MQFPIGPEFIPDYRDLFPGSQLTVPAGTVHTLSGNVEIDAIHVEGELRIATDVPTTLRFVNILINGGTFWCGEDGNSQLQQVHLIKKDVPIDTTFDPFQWGHGLIAINGGTRTICGKTKVGWGTMQEAVVGAMSITLDFDPVGWEVGDELLLPDNRQMAVNSVLTIRPRRESKVFIASITGRTLGLTKALDFEHTNAYDPDWVNFVPPCVANLTRNVNIESENPLGSRGHCAMVMMMASTMTCHTTFRGMGRTRAENIDRTSNDLSHIGTNQIARYADHDHHCHSVPMTRRESCVYINDGNAKWGLVTHQTFDATIVDCVADGFIGSGFITEDGNEVRNVFEHNLACHCPGDGIDGKFNLVAPNNIPGGEGAGFWFHGPKNIVKNNRSCCNALGFQSFYRNFPAGLLVSSGVGGDANTPFDPSVEFPIEFSGNVAAANIVAGFESWNQPFGWTATNLTSANNGVQISMGNSEPGSIKIIGCRLIAQEGAAPGIVSDSAYSDAVEMADGFIVGCSSGVESARSMILTNLTLQNAVNVDESVDRSINLLLDRVLHKQFGTRPKQYIVHGWGNVWQVGDPYPPPKVGAGNYTNWQPHTGARGIIRNWQGTGRDYLFYENNSVRETAAWASTASVFGFKVMCPESGLTMGQCWDKYGLAYGGGVVAQADAVQLEGLINGVAKLWDGSVQTGLPKLILTYPGPAEAIPGGLSEIDLYFVLTGTAHPGQYQIQLDNQPPTIRDVPYLGSGVSVWTPPGAESVGQHTVKTWWLENGVVLPGSLMTFQYAVGEPVVPPIEPPPVEPPVEVWSPADVGPPFAGDADLRVRMGVVQHKTLVPPM